MKDATRVVRAGLRSAEQGSSLLPGPTFASIFHCSGDPASSKYSYGRFHNPTWTAFESALGQLEGGSAISFASGMAAVSALLGTVLGSGDRIVVSKDCYYTTRLLLQEQFQPLGLDLQLFDQTVDDLGTLLRGARLLWVETPSNPELNVYDIPTLAKLARQEGVLLAVDNTTCTPLLQKPLELGADFSVASDSKALAGHGDIILGHIACRSSEWLEALHTWRTRIGSIPGPMEVWLTHRSLGTLDMRLQRMCHNAGRIAGLLESHPQIQQVYYPGLESHSDFPLAERQMKRPGYVLSFELEGKERAQDFLRAARLVDEATSFGSLHTTAERRARWGGDPVSPGFIRMSAGCEDADDLLEDISHALGRSAG